MTLDMLFKCLDETTSVVFSNFVGQENGSSALKNVWKKLESLNDSRDDCSNSFTKIKEKFCVLIDGLQTEMEMDVRFHCTCLTLAILVELKCILENLTPPSHLSILSQSNESETRRNLEVTSQLPKSSLLPPHHVEVKCKGKPSASGDILSVQQTKTVGRCIQIVLFTSFVNSLDAQAAKFVAFSASQQSFPLSDFSMEISNKKRHTILTRLTGEFLNIFLHESLGSCLRRSLLPHFLCGLLQLCFAPPESKDFPEDTIYFREQLESIFSSVESSHLLEQLLIIKGFCSQKISWLKTVCGSLIVRRFLVHSNGVMAIISAGLTICDVQDFQRCHAVAALIFQVSVRDLESFFSAVGPQLSSLCEREMLQPDMMKVIGLVIAGLLQRSPTLTGLYVVNPLIQPLLQTTCEDAEKLIGASVTHCIELLHKLFVQLMDPQCNLLVVLRPVLKPLVAIASLEISHLKSLAKQILARCLMLRSEEDVVDIMLMFCDLEKSQESPSVNSHVRFALDSDGGVKVVANGDGSILDDDIHLSKCLVALFEILKMPAALRNFFSKLAASLDFSCLNGQCCPSSLLVTPAEAAEHQVTALRSTSRVADLLAEVAESETLTDALFSDLEAAVNVAEALLLSGLQVCDDADLCIIRDSLVTNVAMLVTYDMTSRTIAGKVTAGNWQTAQRLLPVLEQLHQILVDDIFVEQLRELLLTHGVLEKCDAAGDAQSEGMEKQTKGRVKKNCKKEMENAEINENNFKSALHDLSSPMLPFRGHGLLVLGKLIDAKDANAMKQKDYLLYVFEQNLMHDDSYIYLMALQGLACLADVFPEKVIPHLTNEFVSTSRRVEDRTKLAEVLTKAARKLGPMLPVYRESFMNSLLAGARDSDSMLRAASLSSLGEVCKELRFSLSGNLYEIFSILSNIVSNDKSPEVRRAAVLVVTLLLRGLGRDTFQVLRDIMRDLYRSLRLINLTDADDVVRLQAQIAIEEIDIITREFLLPKLNLTKTIYVTDVPQ